MVATRFALFFSARSKILRRKIVPDDDAELVRYLPEEGESMLVLPLSAGTDDETCGRAIVAATGVMPSSPRCCVVDERGMVVETANADPELDRHPLGVLVQSDIARPGDRLINGEFHRDGKPLVGSQSQT